MIAQRGWREEDLRKICENIVNHFTFGYKTLQSQRKEKLMNLLVENGKNVKAYLNKSYIDCFTSNNR